jgi:hypothetical protein
MASARMDLQVWSRAGRWGWFRSGDEMSHEVSRKTSFQMRSRISPGRVINRCYLEEDEEEGGSTGVTYAEVVRARCRFVRPFGEARHRMIELMWVGRKRARQ